PPRKGRRHVLRVIREILFFEPRRRKTDLNVALEFLDRVTPHRAIAIILSDFLVSDAADSAKSNVETFAGRTRPALRQANRRHDVVAVQITDRYEFELPALGRLVLEDAETGEVVEINTNDLKRRSAFSARQTAEQKEMERFFRSAGIDTI